MASARLSDLNIPDRLAALSLSMTSSWGGGPGSHIPKPNGSSLVLRAEDAATGRKAP
jgi:hypothetical protein